MNSKLIKTIIFSVVINSLALFVCSHTWAVVKENVFDSELMKLRTIGKDIVESQYVPGEVLVKFKEGIDLQSVLREINLNVTSIERVHSIKPSVTRFMKYYKLEKGFDGMYWFMGKQYKEIGQIPDEEIFHEVYKDMPSAEKSLYRTYKITLPKGIPVEQGVAELNENSYVEYAEPNHIVTIQLIPNDPYYHASGTWGQDYDDLWGIKKMQCEQAWDTTTGGEEIVVAVIDTGLDYNHPDIQANAWTNPIEIPDNDTDDDGNGFIDDYRGWDFYNSDNDPIDDYGHGTHCAGTVAAVGNNNEGVVGVNWQTKIMPVKGFSDEGSGPISVLAEAVRYAANNGAKVLSNSWGGLYNSQILEDAFNYAQSLGVISIASAGNSNLNVEFQTPANIDSVIAVAATDYQDKKAYFSNFGIKIDVAAPGVDILSLRASGTSLGNTVDANYTRLSGTSMACPHVSGIAALLLSQYPSWSDSQIRDQIKGSADIIDVLNPVFKKELGSGRINASRASYPPKPNIAVIDYDIDDSSGNNNGIADPGETINLVITLKNIWLDAINVSATLSTSDPFISLTSTDASFGDISNNTTGNNAASPYSFSVDPDSLSNHKVEFTIEIIANGGSYVDLSIFHIVISDALNYQEGWPIKPQGLGGNSHVTISDIDQNGTKDIILATRTREPFNDLIEVLDFEGNYLSGWPVDLTNDYFDPSTVTAADLDPLYAGEEIIAAFTTNKSPYTTTIHLFHADGTRMTAGGTWPKSIPANAASANIIPIVADIDQDEDFEIILSTNNGIYIWNLDGSDFSGWPSELNFLSHPSIGNIDSDPELEIVVGDTSGSLHAFNHDGTYVFNKEILPGESAQASALGNFDADLMNEIVIQFGDYYVYLIDNDGTIKWEYKTSGMPGIVGEFNGAAIGNVDGTGYPEIIIVSHYYVEGVGNKGHVYMLDSEGVLLPGWPVQTEYPLDLSAVIGDVDGDGDQEIVAMSCITGDIFAWHHDDKNGDGIADLVNGWPITLGGYQFSVPGLADLDNDGDVEIVASARLGHIHVFDSQGVSPNNPYNIEWPMMRANAQYTGRYKPLLPIISPVTPDVNRDGEINEADVEFAVDAVFEKIPYESKGFYADFDGNGKVDITEVQRVINYVIGAWTWPIFEDEAEVRVHVISQNINEIDVTIEGLPPGVSEEDVFSGPFEPIEIPRPNHYSYFLNWPLIGEYNITFVFKEQDKIIKEETLSFTVKLGPDYDGDGIPDDEDACPDSDLTPNVIIDGCDSGVPNTLLPDGCTISDKIAECAAGAENHSDFLSQIDKLLLELQKSKILKPKEKRTIKTCAVQANIP